ncbi:uncharacterized protein LOC110118386 [Ceratitis capitata]|uniref:uncharacterized protein LOC110118386 n=1 Tax=Ceratitis capitata TaxID=7213 RepID=UPI000A122A53|nr:uncharacterized protein LOC110118386 [Ceratitis capitata]
MTRDYAAEKISIEIKPYSLMLYSMRHHLVETIYGPSRVLQLQAGKSRSSHDNNAPHCQLRGLLGSKMRQFCLFTYPPNGKCAPKNRRPLRGIRRRCEWQLACVSATNAIICHKKVPALEKVEK